MRLVMDKSGSGRRHDATAEDERTPLAQLQSLAIAGHPAALQVPPLQQAVLESGACCRAESKVFPLFQRSLAHAGP